VAIRKIEVVKLRLGELGRVALADHWRHFFFFAGLSDFSDFLALVGLLSAFLADFFSSLAFLSFLSEDFESAAAAADFLDGDAFLSFSSLLAFEAPLLLFFSSLATLHLSKCARLARGLRGYSQASY